MARGSVRRRSGAWEIRWEDPPDEDGNRVQRSEGGYRTKKAAEAALNQKQVTLVKPSAEQASEILVEECCKRFVKEHIGKDLRPTSIAVYESFFRRDLLPECGEMPLDKVDRHVLQKVINKMGDRGLAPSTIKVRKAFMGKIFSWCVVEGYLSTTPVKSLTLPEVSGKSVSQILSVPEIVNLLSVLEGTPYWLPTFLGIHTGMRPGEILGLSWDDVDLAEGSLSVNHTLHGIKDGDLRRGPPKTKSSVRSVAVSPEVVDILRELEQIKPQNFWWLRGRRRGEGGERHVAVPMEFDQVCAGPDGKILALQSWEYAFRTILPREGLKQVRPHDLRHMHATHLLLDRWPIHVVSRRLGHKSIQTTIDEYGHLLPNSDPETAVRFSEILKRGS